MGRRITRVRVFSWKFQKERKRPALAPLADPLPRVLLNAPCGALTRAGTPCKIRSVYRSGRCRLHGGLSTGPATAEGKARSALNGKCPKKRTP